MRFRAETLLQVLQSDLSHQVDLDCPSWSIDSTPKEVACYRLRESLVKKLNQADRPHPLAIKAAMEKFMDVNSRCGSWRLDTNFTWEEELINEVKREIYDFWYADAGPLVDDYQAIYSAGRNGPGVSFGVPGDTNAEKLFGGVYTSTPGLADVWRVCVDRDTQIQAAWSELACVPSHELVGGSKMSFVNKTNDIARCIAIEPSANMWMQLGFGAYLEKRLKRRFNIDLQTQPDVNREMALVGSVLDHVVTIDLESASDSMSLGMLRYMLPPSFMAMLERLRSQETVLDGKSVALNMASTMGNGANFPLMTMLLAACCRAAARFVGVTLVTRGPYIERTFAVFGDDIIIDRRVARYVLVLLQHLGFRVNGSKTFVEGPFRESCGVDAFLGVDVRPVYLKRCRTVQDLFVAINRLSYWSDKHGVPLGNTLGYLTSLLPSRDQCRYVPFDEDDTAGIKVPLRVARPRTGPIAGLWRYYPYVVKQAGFVLRDNVLTCNVKGRERQLVLGPSAVTFLALAGYITPAGCSVRQTEPRYVTKTRYSPRWDYGGWGTGAP